MYSPGTGNRYGRRGYSADIYSILEIVILIIFIYISWPNEARTVVNNTFIRPTMGLYKLYDDTTQIKLRRNHQWIGERF